MKLKTNEKQFTKFKDLLQRTIKIEYSKIPNLNNVTGQDKEKEKIIEPELTSILNLKNRDSISDLSQSGINTGRK